jgi:hypothetical protein
MHITYHRMPQVLLVPHSFDQTRWSPHWCCAEKVQSTQEVSYSEFSIAGISIFRAECGKSCWENSMAALSFSDSYVRQNLPGADEMLGTEPFAIQATIHAYQETGW